MIFVRENLFYLALACTGVTFLMVVHSLKRKHPEKDYRLDVVSLMSFVCIGGIGILVSSSQHPWLRWLMLGLAALVIGCWFCVGKVPRWLVAALAGPHLPEPDGKNCSAKGEEK